MEEIHFGVRYQPIEAVESLVTRNCAPNEEESILVKHWVLVLISKSKELVLTVEAVPSSDSRGTICTPFRPAPKKLDSFPLGTYYGEWIDLTKILEAHPQRGSKYSSCFNNCQHFVAIFLLFLEGFAASKSKQSITIEQPKRYAKIRQVLKNVSGTRVWNEPNLLIGGALFMQIPAAGVMAVGTLVAAEGTVATTVVTTGVTTVASTVSAGGLAGFFGATTTVLTPLVVPVTQTVIAPATYAGIVSLCAPFALGLMAVAGIGYVTLRAGWRKETSFDGPLISGFPRGWRDPLTVWECSYSSAVPEGKKTSFRHASAASGAMSPDIFPGELLAHDVGPSSLHGFARDVSQGYKAMSSKGGFLEYDNPWVS